jgi:hypothetical protein
MTDDDRPGDSAEAIIEELLATPVGRRWLMKAGLGSAAALGAGMSLPASAPAAARQQDRPGPKERDFHFALGHARGVKRMRLIANTQEYTLKRHTKASRARLREEEGGVWQHANLSKLTHHVEGVPLPADRAVVLSVRGMMGDTEVLVAQHMHVPVATTRKLARAAQRSKRGLKTVRGSGKRLASLGLKASQVTTPRHVVQLDSLVDTTTTAQTWVMMHPNVATVDPTAAKTTQNLLSVPPAQGSVDALQRKITTMGKAGTPWATHPKITGADGVTPMQFQIEGELQEVTTFKLADDDKLHGNLKDALTAGVRAVRNSPDLGAVIDKPLDATPAAAAKTWVQPSGMVPQSQPYAPPTQLGDAGLQVKIKNPGDLFGTRTVVKGQFSDNKVDLTLYNNWVRWVQVYVQYLGANDTNLSYSSGRTWPGSFPDTPNCEGLVLLPQIFTVLGIPIWDTNTMDVPLTFPDGAHTARLLFCGLGSSINQGDWTQYFAAGTYPTDAIAPKDEVLLPSLVTGIFTIGLTAFALAADFAVATSFAAIRSAIGSGSAAATELAEIARTIGTTLTNVETVALAVGSGAATTADIETNGNSADVWSILLEFGTMLPKLLFRPNMDVFWIKVASDVIGGFTGYRIANAIPFIGEVLAAIAVIGDVATLAEECAETIVAPWVIENEVNLVYAAKVTASRDSTNSSTWPTTARNWSLQANIDGAAVLAPITGTVNDDPDRGTRTEPLELDVQAPFGGSTIQWSFTLTDAAGNQVGTGVSAKFPNNDQNNTASVVPITFEQIPVPIDDKTTFERTDTTCFTDTANGYTWSSRVTSSGTVADKGIQSVAGASISTLAGVAGVVWEQGDKFYVRGVPTGQDAATIKLGQATANGFGRRPFLLLDPFVTKTSAGNHVLLEPDDSLPVYYVRKVTLDPVSGAPTWDPKVSYGTFTLPISAAALHSSGRVVAVNTDTGRLATILPANPDRPALAAYSAGTGDTVGLLQSPVAVAVTNPGTVLVLEAAATQIAAFDLNGNPVRYFPAAGTTRRGLVRGQRQASDQGSFTLKLPAASYLDLAVDGAGQMYVLYHTGDGTAPADYRVDIYTAAGVLLNSASSGVNVPHLAVDNWRSLFAPNFDPLSDLQTGKTVIDTALGVAEPSVSRFDPVNAAKATRRRQRRRRRRGRAAR